jgi:hypothetical protein
VTVLSVLALVLGCVIPTGLIIVIALLFKPESLMSMVDWFGR